MNTYSDITLNIDLGAVVSNYNRLRDLAPTAICAAVVKANCYGLGVADVAPVLLKNDCNDFFVATLDEGVQLRKLFENCGMPNIYVFHGIKKGEEGEFANSNLTPVINDFYQLEVLSNYAKEKNTTQNAVLHFDTGMNRLGFCYPNAKEVKNSKFLKNIDVKYIMSHFSCITVEDHELNKLQLERLKDVQKLFPQIPVSFANSRGILTSSKYHFDMVRPGSYLYGVSGLSGLFKSETVVTLKAKILQIRKIKDEGVIGYCGASKAEKGMRIAVTPLGYADGYSRILTGNSYAFYKGHKLPLLGRVSMDMTIWDISSVPENEINVGSEIELLGQNITADELACRAQTIGYEILTRLGNRYKRVVR